MEEQISNRFVDLVQEGRNLIQQVSRGEEYYVGENNLSVCQGWIMSVINLIKLATTEKSAYASECEKILNHDDMKYDISIRIVKKILGLLESAHKEWAKGLLKEIEYMVAASTFDDFLDHAEVYHKGNKKIEASVLSSAVLEDTIKKICKKHKMETANKSLEPLIDALIEGSVFTPVKGKRVKGFSAVRNYALHAEWDKFDINDVGSLIKGLRELIADYL